MTSLTFFWYLIMVALFLLYVVLDGFDLGAGILCLIYRTERFHDAAVESIYGVWHANQTLLVVFGSALFGAFPLAYSVAISALYLPVVLLLAGLILRGFTIELYEMADNKRRVGLLFGLGSLLATMAQGLGVGAVLIGLPAAHGHFGGGLWAWLRPFPVLLALGLPLFYLLLGAARLADKTEGDVRAACLKAGKIVVWPAALAAAAVVIWGLAAGHAWASGRLSGTRFALTLLPIALGALLFIPIIAGLSRGSEKKPFFLTLAMMALIGIGIAGGQYPFVIPPDLTLVKAAAGPVVHKVMLGVFLVVGPLVLLYSIYMYRVFRGKIREDDHREEPSVSR